MLKRWLQMKQEQKHWRFRLAITLVGTALIAWAYFGGPKPALWVTMAVWVVTALAYRPSDRRVYLERKARSQKP